MHELSVAQRLVELVTDAVGTGADGTAPRVTSVRLRLGPLSGVVAQALRFVFDEAAAGTPLQGAALVIDEVAPAIFCPRCNAERELPDIRLLRCPACGTPTPDVIRGRELEVTSVEVITPSPPPASNEVPPA